MMATVVCLPSTVFRCQLKFLLISLLLCADLVHGFHNHRVQQATRSLTQRLMAAFPSMIVFDLDNTVWTPELYQLRKHERAGTTPIAGKDVQLFEGSQAVFDAIRRGDYPEGTKFAVASRTKSVEWAHDLLDQFRLRELLDYVEIFPGNKRAHFSNLKEASGIDYNQMLFFDDARGGKFGNCEPVSEMGVLAVHCADGLKNYDIFKTALQRFEEWDRSPSTIIEWDGSVTNPKTLATQRQEGVIKAVNSEKNYGFITYGDRGTKDVFFHFNNLRDGLTVEEGDQVSFVVKQDPKNGKSFASDLEVQSATSKVQSATSKKTVATSKDTVAMRAFSMNLPFAALLANGYKTLETRNGTMFVPYPEGTQMLLHVGKRIYPDGNKHIDVMKSGGLNDKEIEDLKSLPQGFGKGMAVAVCEIGKTYESTTAERSVPDFQRGVAAFGADSGRMVTEIKRVAYLKRPVQVSGQGGVFNAQIDPDVLPDGWTLQTKDSKRTGTVRSGKPVYSISG